MAKNSSEYTFIFLEIPIEALCLMMQSSNQPTLLVPAGVLTGSNYSYLLHFPVFKAFKAFFQN